MRVVLSILAVVVTIPVLLVVAVALGPVIVGILCAAAFGLLVFAIWSTLVALGLFGRSRIQHARHEHGPGTGH